MGIAEAQMKQMVRAILAGHKTQTRRLVTVRDMTRREPTPPTATRAGSVVTAWWCLWKAGQLWEERLRIEKHLQKVRPISGVRRRRGRSKG